MIRLQTEGFAAQANKGGANKGVRNLFLNTACNWYNPDTDQLVTTANHGARGASSGIDRWDSWDRFGRTASQKWVDGSTVQDQTDYTYDYAGNRLSRDIPSSLYSTNDKDQVYTYDDLHRLKTFDSGTLSGSTISGTPKAEQDFTLDQLGNWDTLVKKTSGTTDYTQTRTHNEANELSTITNWARRVKKLNLPESSLKIR